MIKVIQIVVSVLVFNGYLFAVSPLSFYKQIGSVSALSESCLQSTKIPTKLQFALNDSGLYQSMINTLVDAYNQGYKNTLLSHKVWNASLEMWNKTPFSCSNKKDLKQIKDFEKSILETL